MKVAIDSFEANFEERVGTGNYVYNLVKALAKIDSKNNYRLYLKKPVSKEFYFEQKNFHFRPLGSLTYRTFWSQMRLPVELFSHKPEILHIPAGHKIPPFQPCKTIVTIYDTAFLTFKNYFHPSVRWRSVKFTRHAIRHADRIIAISESTKKDITDFYEVNPDRIVVIYLGVEEIYRPLNDMDRINKIRQKYNVKSDYILFVGVLQPRKNISRLIKAFNSLLRRKEKDYQLVIVGKKGWLYKEIFQTVKELRLEDKVIFTGYVPREEIPILMNGAKLFVFPSLYEGFGIPLLEAMACGTPVIASKVSSIPEIVGDAGCLFDPYNEKEITEVMFDVLSKEGLRKEMSKNGLERAKLFSWEKAARETLSVYEEVYKQNRPLADSLSPLSISSYIIKDKNKK